MSKKKVNLGIILIVSMAIAAIYIIITYYNMIDVDLSVEVTNGVLDIENVNLDEQVARIIGYSECYQNKLYTPEDFSDGGIHEEKCTAEKLNISNGYGTCRIVLKGKPNKNYTISGFSTNYCMKVYVNRMLVVTVGEVAEYKEETVPQTGINDIQICTDENGYAEIVWQFSNLWNIRRKDTGTFYIASFEKMGEYRTKKELSSLFWNGGLVFIGLYFLTCAVIHKRKDYFMLAVCCVFAGIRDYEFFHIYLLPANMNWFVKNRIFMIITGMLPGVICLLIAYLYPWNIKTYLGKIYMVLQIVFVICFVTVPVDKLSLVNGTCHYIAIPAILYNLVNIVVYYKKIKKIASGGKARFLSLVMLLLSILTEMLIMKADSSAKFNGLVSMEIIVVACSMGFYINLWIREAEEKLKQAKDDEELIKKMNDLKMKFFRRMIHEMKTPLTVMSGYAQLTKMQIQNNSTDEETNNNLDVIVSESDRLSEMVKGLLESEGLVAENAFEIKVDIDKLLEEAASLCRPICERNHNEVKITAKHELIASGNKEMLLRIILNIVFNATRHTKNDIIDINVTDCEDNKMIQFTLSNNGEPINAEDAKHIFDEGFSPDGGSGLGLVICRDLLKSMNGEIWLEQSDEEKTTFIFRVPIWEE